MSQMKDVCKVSLDTGIHVYQYLRDVCSWKLQQHVIRLGGIGLVQSNVVEIDESCFPHKPKVIALNITVWTVKSYPVKLYSTTEDEHNVTQCGFLELLM